MTYSYLNGGSIHVTLPGHMQTDLFKPTHLQHPPRYTKAECAAKLIALPTGRVVSVRDASDDEFGQFIEALLMAIYPSSPAARAARIAEWFAGDWLPDARVWVLLEALKLMQKRKCRFVLFVEAQVESEGAA